MALSPDFEQVQVDLKGIGLNNPTSLQFGPDGRLYVSQQDGLIRSINLKTITDNDGNITKFVINNAGGSDSTDLVQNIPNHDDNGDLNISVNKRQVTGMVLEEGDNGEVILYVSSSDSRIGGGGSGNDKSLDTNSGIISRLTKTGNNSWEKVDLVIGLPRSEENHSTNGMDIRTEEVEPGVFHKIMYVASGGSTNRGAPSNNFAWTPEYYYSAAVLRIDVTQLEEIEATEGLKGGTDYVDEYVYALPTLNDPTRPDNGQGQDTANGTTGPADAEAADTFGGNDGRNQAKYDPNGPVQVYSMGYRNSYDIVITENNNIYTFDNGPNNGWGDKPLEADGSTPIDSSSQVTTNYPNINVNTGNDSDPDNLHLVTEGFYGGHPNPVYASGAAANLYWVDTSSGSPVVKQLTDPSDPSNDPTTTLDDLPSDWSTIAGGFTNPEAGVYLTPGSNPFGANKGPDGSLVTIGSSTNGIAEYRAGKTTGSYSITDVPGAEILMAVSFNQNLYFMEIEGDGTQAGTNLTDIEAVLVGGTPLDVRDVEAFAVGTQNFKDSIFIAQFGSDQISALVPSMPTLTDVDKDDDGLKDSIDPLQYDPDNGTNTLLNPGETLFWDLNPIGNHPGPSGDYNIGMTGWMINDSWFLEEDGIAPVDDPNRFIDPALVDLNNTIRGGAPGVVQVKSVTPGDLEGPGNDQQDAIQTGFLPGADVSQFTIRVPIFNPFTSDANSGVNFSESASIGFSLGDGTMSNWIGIAVAADDSSGAQVKLTYEENDSTITSLSVDAPELLTAVDDDLIELSLTVDLNTYEVTPSWRYETQGSWSAINQLGSSPVPLNSSGEIVKALQGNKFITGDDGAGNPPVTLQSAPVVTLLSTSKGSQPFTADFPDLTISTPSVVVKESGSETQVTEGGFIETYSLVLSTQPTLDVTVSLSPDAQVTLDKTEVVFTPTNWAEPQAVTITAIDDSDIEGNHTGQIAHQLITSDSDYAPLTVPNLVVDVVDDDVPQVLFLETDGSTEVAEGGFADTYSLVLSIQPTSDVTVSFSPDAQVTLDKTEVVFTPTNWAEPQAVTIVAVDDSDIEGNHTGQIAHQLSTSDSDYALVTVPDLVVDVVDNDEPVILHRINVGGPQLASADASIPDWSEDTKSNNPSFFRIGSGGNKSYTTSGAIDLSDPSLPDSVPEALFQSERWDPPSGENMQWEFPVNPGSHVEVRLYFAEIYKPIVAAGQRVFDVSVEGVVPTVFDDIDPYGTAGYGAFMLSHTLTVNDNGLNLEFFQGIENPALKGIEILSDQVLDDIAPTITTADLVTMPENQTQVLNVNTTDVNGDTEGNGLTYSLTGGVDQGTFAIDSNTGMLSFTTAPDFENPSDDNLDNLYQVEVTVTDSTGLTDAQLISVSVTDVNEAPTITTADLVTIDENETAVLDVNATDVNGDTEGNGLTYSLTGGVDQGTFAIDSNTGLLSFTTAPDFENPGDSGADNTYEVEVTVTDSTGLTDVQPISVSVSDVNENGNESGEAILTITLNANDIQISNFGNNSFQITNTGQKKIAQVEIDVTNALYPDTVFDPFGVAGDTVSKKLTINTNGGTGVDAPSNGSYIGDGGLVGYEGLRLTFDETVDGGFESGETIGFSVDMDANSIAGAQKNLLDAGTDPDWDVGGVSGAELIGSTFTVTFTDGTTATGQLQGAGNQAGSQGLASQDSANLSSSLTVNGLGAGEVGTYDQNGPSVIVTGPAGETARVVLTKGFIQPVTNEFFNGNSSQQNYAPTLQAQLDALAASDFPANNAVEFQTVDIVLTGGAQDISGQFDFSGVPLYDFEGEDRLPLGFVASVIDPTNNNLPMGPVTQPIYLQFPGLMGNEVSIVTALEAAEPDVNGQFSVSLTEVTTTDTVITYSVTGTATPDGDYTALSGTVTIPTGNLSAPIDVMVLDDSEIEGSENVIITLDSITAGDSDVLLSPTNDSATVTIADDDNGTEVSIASSQNASEPDNNGQFNVSLSEIATTDTVVTYTVTGTATPNEDYTALSETVTISAGELFAPIDVTVLDDSEIEGSENVTITLDSITAGDSDVLLSPTNDSATVTIADNDLLLSPIKIEAEAADTILNYRTERIGAASGDRVLGLSDGGTNEVGSATFGFNGAVGNYDILLGAFDENDGEAQFVLELNDVETGTTTQIGSWVLDDDLGSSRAKGKTFVSTTVAFGIGLTPGDTITVNAFEDGNEHARFDFIQFEPVI